jgi:AraC-like DNA-binding protein
LIFIILLIGTAGFAFFLISFRFSEYRQGLFLKRSWSKEILDKEAAKKNMEQLTSLMEKEELFKDYNLSLGFLAKKMGLSQNELSFLINSATGMNFRTYINTCRLNNILKELVTQPEMSILTIAYENGFNSKTSFNTFFIKMVGTSPREYRKKMLQNTGKV